MKQLESGGKDEFYVQQLRQRDERVSKSANSIIKTESCRENFSNDFANHNDYGRNTTNARSFLIPIDYLCHSDSKSYR